MDNLVYSGCSELEMNVFITSLKTKGCFSKLRTAFDHATVKN